jgi:hypothetical protein
MKPTVLLDKLQAHGVVLEAIGDQLKLTAPVGLLTAADRAACQEHKAAILALLESASAACDAPRADALASLAREVEVNRCADVPELVGATARLIELWRDAEAECGHALTLAGKRRQCVANGGARHGA